MNAVDRWRSELLARPRDTWPALLDAHPGLPGRRANLELAAAFAALADADTVAALLASDDEYRVFCAAVALGELAANVGDGGRGGPGERAGHDNAEPTAAFEDGGRSDLARPDGAPPDVAAPEVGLPRFHVFDTGDADLARVVRENRKKARLARLLGEVAP